MKTLYKTRRKKDTHLIAGKFFVFDVETNGLQATPDKFIFGCIYGENYKRVFYSVEEFKELVKEKRFRHKYIFAHNAEFDLSVIYGNIKKQLDVKSVFNSGFILAKQGSTYFADSLNIFKTSVKELGKNLGIEKMELEETYKTGKVKKISQKMVDYCFRDCEIVYKSLLKMFTVVGSVKPTLAGCALMLYRNNYQPFHIRYNEKLSNEFFNSYYGGRVECFKLGATDSKKYDINSMYPFAMVNATFPNPNFLKVEKNCTYNRLHYHFKYHEGVAHLTVRHKPFMFGFLPVKKDNKLIFPAGVFSGWYNFNEIKFALQIGTVEIIKIHSVIYSRPMVSPFIDYVNDLYEKRKASKGIDNVIYKNLLNNLYGKFAQKDKFEEIYFEELPLDEISKLIDKGVKYEIIHFNKTRSDGYLKIPCKHKTRLHTIALFSSYITSFARVHLLKSMLQFQKNKITYLDTDCIALEKNIEGFNNSFELGDFKLEEDRITEIFGNKSYNYQKGEIKGKKLKGVPLKSKSIQIISENEYKFTKLIKTKEAIRRNITAGMPVEVTKKLKFNYDKREIKKSGNTKILFLSEKPD